LILQGKEFFREGNHHCFVRCFTAIVFSRCREEGGTPGIRFLVLLKSISLSENLMSAIRQVHWGRAVVAGFLGVTSSIRYCRSLNRWNKLQVDPKLVADQLGHTLDVNQNVYSIPELGRRREAVNQLAAALQIS
jgi:hypothetical protein